MWDDLEWYLTAMYVFAVIGFLVVLGGAAWMLWRVLDAVLLEERRRCLLGSTHSGAMVSLRVPKFRPG